MRTGAVLLSKGNRRRGPEIVCSRPVARATGLSAEPALKPIQGRALWNPRTLVIVLIREFLFEDSFPPRIVETKGAMAAPALTMARCRSDLGRRGAAVSPCRFSIHQRVNESV